MSADLPEKYSKKFASDPQKRFQSLKERISENVPKWFTLTVASSTEQILDHNFAETKLFQLESERRIFVIDFMGLQEQGLTMNRMAMFVENNNAPKDRVLNNVELDKKIQESGETVSTLCLGHDYKSEDMARFFTLAEKGKVELNDNEEGLLALLLYHKVIIKKGDEYEATIPSKVLITFYQNQKNYSQTHQWEIDSSKTRKAVLEHELSHGKYFTEEKYAQYCKNFWKNILTDAEKSVWKKYFKKIGYDTRNEDLMINEMQAHLIDAEVPDTVFEKYDISVQRMRELRHLFMKDVTPQPQV